MGFRRLEENLIDLVKEQQAKLHLLLDFAERQGDIEDPWYTDDFDRAYRDILRGCEGLLRNLTENKTA